MTVLLNCSLSWSQNNDSILSTGVLEQTDSLVLIPISALKIANAKMTELKYEKEENSALRAIVHNDSLIIKSLNIELERVQIEYTKNVNRFRKQRNTLLGTSGGLLLLLIIALL